MSTEQPATRRDRTHYLYIAVIVAVFLGIAVGLLFPGFAKELKPLGTGFVNLIKMMISPIISCTIVLGVGSVARAAKVGKVGGLAIGYFLIMSTVALVIGLIVGNLLHPGSGLHITASIAKQGQSQITASQNTAEFLLSIIPTTLVSAFTSGQILQTLLVALLGGFALQKLGPKGEPIRRGVEHIQRWVFRILAMIMWAAPLGAFGAMAAVVGGSGWAALKGLLIIMVGFYITCLLFVFVILGALTWLFTRINIFRLFRYLVGITVPTGYSFNLDGTAIYLTMASLFIADALNKPLSLGEQISQLVFVIIASKGAAGVTGAGLATLAGGRSAHRPELVDGVGFIVGIDRFMSEARALTNFAGNSVATVLIGTWTNDIDKEQVNRVLAGEDPFGETTLLDEHIEKAAS
jgi:aerobic C4-dicarboxylate transport protein